MMAFMMAWLTNVHGSRGECLHCHLVGRQLCPLAGFGVLLEEVHAQRVVPAAAIADRIMPMLTSDMRVIESLPMT